MRQWTIRIQDTQALAEAFLALANEKKASHPLTCGAAVALWMGLNVKIDDAHAFFSHVRSGSEALMNIVNPRGPLPPGTPSHFADRWQYTGGDDCCRFFTACLKAARYDLHPGARVLEVGCAEYDWIGEMVRQCPDIHVTGIDWRQTHRGIQGDVLTYEFPPNYFDACVAISALEHIGLGHYDHDPIDPYGDMLALIRIWRWLKPGGIVYCDVPYHPERYAVQGTSHREYHEAALDFRLIRSMPWRERWRGWAVPGQGDQLLSERPTAPREGGEYYYVGLVLQKV